MNAPAVIVVYIGPDNTVQMPLVQNDHMVKRIAPNAADDPFAVRILSWRSWGCLHFFDSHIPDSVLKMIAVDTIAIPD